MKSASEQTRSEVCNSWISESQKKPLLNLIKEKSTWSPAAEETFALASLASDSEQQEQNNRSKEKENPILPADGLLQVTFLQKMKNRFSSRNLQLQDT